MTISTDNNLSAGQSRKNKTRRIRLNDTKLSTSFFVNVRQGNPRKDGAGEKGNLRRSKFKNDFLATVYGQGNELRSDSNLEGRSLRENRLDVSVGTFDEAIGIEKHSTPRNRTDEKNEATGMTTQRQRFLDVSGEQNGDEWTRKKTKHKKSDDVNEVRAKKKKAGVAQSSLVDDGSILKSEDGKVKKKDEGEVQGDEKVDTNSDSKSERKKKRRKKRDGEGASFEETELSTASSVHSYRLPSGDGSCEQMNKVKKKKKQKQSLEEEVELVGCERAKKDYLEEDVSIGTNFEDSFELSPVKKKKKKRRRDLNEDTDVEKKKKMLELGDYGDGHNVESSFEGNEGQKCRKKDKRRNSLSAGKENLSEIDPKHADIVRPKEKAKKAEEVMNEGKKEKTEVAGPKTNQGERNKPAGTGKPKKKRRLYNEDLQTEMDEGPNNKANEKKKHLDVLFAQMEKSYENKLTNNKVNEKPVKHLDAVFAQMEKSYENKLAKKEKKKKNKPSVEVKDRLGYTYQAREDVEKSPFEFVSSGNHAGLLEPMIEIVEEDCNFEEDKGPSKHKNTGLLKPKIEILEEDPNIEHLQNLSDLTIHLPFEPPPLHTIETRMSTRPTKEQLQQIEALDIPIRKGKFLKAEDEKIGENWRDFRERHGLPDDKGPFLKFVHGGVSSVPVLRYEERIKFVQNLARGLDDRLLWTVYTRFQTMFTPTLKGNFTPEEDEIITEYMREHKGDFKTYSILAQKLMRPRLLVEKRYRDLMLQKQYDTPKKRKKNKSRKILNALMQHLNVQDVQKLKDRKITKEEWEAVSAAAKMLPFNAKKVWLTTVYPSLFSVERTKFKIVQTLVDLIYESGATDRNEVKCSDYVKYFDGCTKEALSLWLNRYLKSVPDRCNRSFRETITFLKESFFPHSSVNDSIRNIDESCRSEEDNEVAVKQEDIFIWQNHSIFS